MHIINKLSGNSRKGQILLITLLVMSIATTIALSLVARSTVDLNMSSQIEESSRAFSAAEAGIEQALLDMSAPADSTLAGSGASFHVNQSNIGGDMSPIVFDSITQNGDSESVWLIEHDGTDINPSMPSYSNDSISVCWSSGAVVVTVYYLRSGEYEVAKAGYDSNTSRTGSQSESNRFEGYNSTGDCNTGSGAYYIKNISFNADMGIDVASDKLFLMQIRPVYNDAMLAVSPAGNIPLQGFLFNSCGTTQTGTTRCINVTERYRAVSSIFDHALYVNNGVISK